MTGSWLYRLRELSHRRAHDGDRRATVALDGRLTRPIDLGEAGV